PALFLSIWLLIYAGLLFALSVILERRRTRLRGAFQSNASAGTSFFRSDRARLTRFVNRFIGIPHFFLPPYPPPPSPAHVVFAQLTRYIRAGGEGSSSHPLFAKNIVQRLASPFGLCTSSRY